MLVNHVALVPGRLTKAHHAEIARELPRVARALQKQVKRDFGPVWGISASVAAYASIADVPVGGWPVIIDERLRNPTDSGFHWDPFDQPLARMAYDVNNAWTATASHEILEMLADPYGERMTAAPSIDPRYRAHTVLYQVEVCDPCENVTYEIDGVTVSDFITPDYFDAKASARKRYSFKRAVKRPREVLIGGYLSWSDPELGWAFELDRFKRDATIKRLYQLPGPRWPG
jgi:hypothetical protein